MDILGWKFRFVWKEYLRAKRAEAVPSEAFCSRNPIQFAVGMVLEVVDVCNPSIIRPARIVMVDDYEIKVLFLEWPESYAFWLSDDSPDIHPTGWCRRTGHPIIGPQCKCSITHKNQIFKLKLKFIPQMEKMLQICRPHAVFLDAMALATFVTQINLLTEPPPTVRTAMKIGPTIKSLDYRID